MNRGDGPFSRSARDRQGQDPWPRQGKRAGQPPGSLRGKDSKLSSLTSSATDDEFYSSLAQMADDSLDEDNEENSMSEVDAKKLANSLAGMDDLDSDLFGSSLTKKKSPRTPSKSTPSMASSKQDGAITDKGASKPTQEPPAPAVSPRETEASKSVGKSPSGSSKSVKKFDINKFDSLEFDEEDPLAGLLSDEEDMDSKPKPKPKKTPTPKRTAAASQEPVAGPVKPEPIPQKTDIDRPKTSRSRRQESPEAGLGSPPGSPDRHTPVDKKNSNSLDVSTESTEAGKSVETPPAVSPRTKGRRAASKAKEDINFESDDDLPGLDETPRDIPTPPSRGKGRKAKTEGDLFGDDAGLFGLDEGKPSTKEPSSSRFSDLLGGKKDDAKKQKPKTLDDFVTNISGKREEGHQSLTKKNLSPTSEDSFQFGGYTPSAATGPGRSRSGMARPDTAPGPSRRSVRFAEDLGLGDDIFGSGRPSTAPSERQQGSLGRHSGTGEAKDAGVSFPDDVSPRRESRRKDPAEESKRESDPSLPSEKAKEQKTADGRPSGSSADWLGLGGSDTGLELPISTPKPIASTASISKKPEPDRDVTPNSKSPEGTPMRLRRQGSGDGDEFLKMLGITPEQPPSTPEQQGRQESKLPWEGGARRGRRWRDQSAPEGGTLQLSSAGPSSSEVKPNTQDTASRPAESARGSERDQSPSPWQPGQSRRRQEPPPQAQEPMATATSLGQPTEAQNTVAGEVLGQQSTPQNQTVQTMTYERRDHGQYQAPAKQQQTEHQTPLGVTQTQANIESSQAQPLQPTQYYSPYAQYQAPHGQGVIQAQSTLSSVPQPTQTMSLEQQRAVEYEVQLDQQGRNKATQLMRRLPEMESTSHSREVVEAGYVAQLEAKVRHLELENDQLQTSLGSLKHRHQTEQANIETSHTAHVKTLEESYQRRETRINEETDLQISHYNERIRAVEDEKADIQSSQARKGQMIESRWTAEVDRLKELHRKAIEDQRKDNEEEIAHLRRLKEQEVSAATSAHAHTKSLQSLMQQVLNSTKDVSDMKFQIETTHKSGMEERQLAAKVRDDYLTQLQERLVRQQAENEEERARLQGLIAKMEIHMREQTRQMDQERWRLTQEETRVKTIQGALDGERRITMEQLAAERAEVQRARAELLREQQRVTTQLQEERRAVSMERAQLSSTHREIITREKHKTESTIQAEADLEATAAKIKEDAASLGVQQAQLKQEQERLAREKREFDRRREMYENEKERLGKLSLEVQRRSEEIGELCAEATRAREEGDEALAVAERLSLETENERAETENQLVILQDKERQLAQDRVAIAHERRLLEKDKQAGRCRECENRRTTPSPNTDHPSVTIRPVSSAYEPLDTSQSLHLGTPDILLNSLELKRTLRKWSSDKEKDEEFLEQESMFLSHLQRSRNNIKSRQSLTSSPAH